MKLFCMLGLHEWYNTRSNPGATLAYAPTHRCHSCPIERAGWIKITYWHRCLVYWRLCWRFKTYHATRWPHIFPDYV